jgi:hypothetical protein
MLRVADTVNFWDMKDLGQQKAKKPVENFPPAGHF